MTITYLLVLVLTYATGPVYTQDPWVMPDGDSCRTAQDILNTGRGQLDNHPGQPVKQIWACVRWVQP